MMLPSGIAGAAKRDAEDKHAAAAAGCKKLVYVTSNSVNRPEKTIVCFLNCAHAGVAPR